MVPRSRGHLCSTGFGAGGILLSLPAASLGDGMPWVTFSLDDGPWTDLADGRGHPPPIGPAGFARAGAHLAVAPQLGGRQLDLFAVGDDGAVWVTFTVDDGPWTAGVGGRTPFRVSPLQFAPPGRRWPWPPRTVESSWTCSPCATTARSGPRSPGTTARGPTATMDAPFRLSPTGFAPPGALMAVAAQHGGRQLDVFTVGHDGAVWVGVRSMTVPGPTATTGAHHSCQPGPGSRRLARISPWRGSLADANWMCSRWARRGCVGHVHGGRWSVDGWRSWASVPPEPGRVRASRVAVDRGHPA